MAAVRVLASFRPLPASLMRRTASALVVGLTGPNASGKGEAAAFLRARGYAVHSLSDVVRDEAARVGRDHTRDSLIRTGREMRAHGGPGALARGLLPRLVPPCVVDSVRNPGEVEVLRALPGFRLLGVAAPTEVRYERTRRRARAGDPETMDEFQEKERIEDSDDKEGQRSTATLLCADAVVQNDGTLKDFLRRIAEVVARWEKEVA